MNNLEGHTSNKYREQVKRTQRPIWIPVGLLKLALRTLKISRAVENSKPKAIVNRRSGKKLMN